MQFRYPARLNECVQMTPELFSGALQVISFNHIG